MISFWLFTSEVHSGKGIAQKEGFSVDKWVTEQVSSKKGLKEQELSEG
ncbi:MAG: hypothetical protein LBC85_11055 [Fibromonadaceae bacterium]|jgi:hypothetical protein|nr:hypothetical protein [Fibromonadaceae bacterium]